MKKINEAVVICDDARNTELPVLRVIADTLPEAWEASVQAVWEHGAVIHTQYDAEGDPPSRDVCLMMTIRRPFEEPRIHLAFPGGIEDLEIYRQEVLDGIHDHWIDPDNGKWEYTYHERLCDYKVPIDCEKGVDIGPIKLGATPKTKIVKIDGYKHINQIQYIIDTLVKCPYSRRAQAITWKPWEDCGIYDPACLQSIWCRIFNNELVMNVRMRSNDAFKACFMNMYAFTDLQRYIAEEISKRLGRHIKVGQYNHMVDSYHIYGSYFEEFKKFLETLEKRSYDKRVWRTEDVQDIIDEARVKIAASLEEEKKSGRKGI